MPRSHVEHSQRTHPIHPIGQYTDVLVRSYCLGAFGTVWLPYETRCKTCRTSANFVPRSGVGIFRNEGSRSTPCDPKLIFWCVRAIWVHSGLFGCLTKLGAKWAELLQRFVPRSRVRILRNERTRSTPLDSKLTFWRVSYRLGAFETVWLPYETRYKTGQSLCHKVALEFFASNTSDPPYCTLN